MKNKLILSAILFTIFVDFFNLGLIYPIFSALIFEGNISSQFSKNVLFALLIAAFPLGQFLGAPVIGQLSDEYGRRKLLILSLFGTAGTLLICAGGIAINSLLLLLMGRFLGGLMAGNMTLAYASLADFSTPEDKVNNFALIPLVIGLGFATGPYFAGVLSLTSQALPLFLATFLTLFNLFLVYWKFPETVRAPKEGQKRYERITQLGQALRQKNIRPYLWILFLMISSNLVFVQFVGPYAIERFQISVIEVGYLYANIGASVSLGHLFLTRKLSRYFSTEKALMGSLIMLALLLVALLFSSNFFILQFFTFFIMLACAVGYTNSMALVSNQAPKEKQGEIMGVAVSIQSCAEFLPALALGLVASFLQSLPLLVAALFAAFSYLILRSKQIKGAAGAEAGGAGMEYPKRNFKNNT